MERPIRGMDSVVATVSGYHGSERFNLIKLISQSGASYVGAMSRSTTHLVCWKFEGKKYKLAKKFKIIIVNHRWVEDCLKQGTRLEEHPYMLQSGDEMGPLSIGLPIFENCKVFADRSNVYDDDASDRGRSDTSREDPSLVAWTDSFLLDENLFPDAVRSRFNSHKSKPKHAKKTSKQEECSSRYCLQDPPITELGRMEFVKEKRKILAKEGSSTFSGMHFLQGKRKVSDDIGSSSVSEPSHRGRRLAMKGFDGNNLESFVLDSDPDSPVRLDKKNSSKKSPSKCVDIKKKKNIFDNGGTSNASRNDDALDDIEEIVNWNHLPASKDSNSFPKERFTERSNLCSDIELDGNIKDESKFEMLTKLSTQVELSCVICWTEFSSTRGVLPCGHRFCYTCIQKWADRASSRQLPTCPLCKVSFVSITKVEDAGTSDQKIYSQTIPCVSSTSDILILSDRETYRSGAALSSSTQVCSQCRSREPADLLISCDHCDLQCIHSYCLDPPLLPWTCINCKDLQMLYRHNC